MWEVASGFRIKNVGGKKVRRNVEYAVYLTTFPVTAGTFLLLFEL